MAHNIIFLDENMKRVDKDNREVIPTIPAVTFPKAFDRIRGEKRWCSWKWAFIGDRWTKPPMRAFNEDFASVSNPETWDSLEAVQLRAAEKYGIRGVGLMLSGLPMLGVIDLDKCVDENGELADWAENLIYESGSYAEVSPSRTGLKIFGFVKGRDSLSSKIKRDGHEFELFLNTNRYVCLTGERVGKYEFLADITSVFERLAGPDQDRAERGERSDNMVLLDPKGIKAALWEKWDADDYKDWIDACYALRSYGDEGRALWEEWSAQSSKYTKKRNDSEWASAEPHSIDIGSIFYRAMERGFKNDGHWDKKEGGDAPRQFNTDDDAEDQPKEYLINDFIRAGTFAFAGEPSGGKSTMLVSLAAIVAGLALNVDDTIKTFLHRRVLWFAEAPEQITDILKVMRENDRLVNDRSRVRDMIRVYYSRRGEPDYWTKHLPNLLKNLEYENTLPDGTKHMAKPLVVFDTSSANFDIESENDNAEVSRLIANVRRILLGYSAWLITHTAKVPRDVSVFDLDNRGASAWKGDVEGTAVIGKERNPALREMRFLRFKKRRYAAPFDWIIGERELFQTEHKVVGAPGGVKVSYVDTVKLRLVSERDGLEMIESATEEAEERQLDARAETVRNSAQEAANATMAEGFEGLVIRSGRGNSPGPILGYEKLKRVSMDELMKNICGVRSNKDRDWFKSVIENLFETNGDILAVRAQTFEIGG